MGELIDTTQMYLKTIYEMIEDGVTPLRARIVERIGHSGPTVSQTVGRMERDDLVKVLPDRRLQLTEKGQRIATKVMRKHRLAERLLLDVVGLDKQLIHKESCRWEHVMSDEVEIKLVELLRKPTRDPFGNPIPESGAKSVGISLIEMVEDGADAKVIIERIGEPVQGDERVLSSLESAQIRPGKEVRISRLSDAMFLRTDTDSVAVHISLARRIFAIPA